MMEKFFASFFQKRSAFFLTFYLLIAATLLAHVVYGCSIHIPGQQGIGSPRLISLFVTSCLLACGAYALAVYLVLRHPPRLWLVLAVAVVLRALLCVAPPFLSTDLYRYVWDGRMQIAGINPYLYVPAAPELRSLREDKIFPNINRPDYARTIYPPVAQLIFRLVATVRQSPYAIKTAMALFDLGTILVLMRLLFLAGRPLSQVLIYAWHPLPVWEFAGNGHVDAAAIFFIALMLLAALVRRPAAAAFALAAAFLVKLLPVVLLAVIWRRWNWRVPLVFITAVALAYLVYARAGRLVLGFLPGYAAEEEGGGERLFLLAGLAHLIHLPAWASLVYFALGALALLALGAAIALPATPMLAKGATSRAVDQLATHALLLMTTLTLVLSPHYPWYFAWLLLPCCLRPTISVLYLTSAAFLIYLASYDSDLLWPCLIYIPFMLLALRDLTGSLPTLRHRTA